MTNVRRNELLDLGGFTERLFRELSGHIPASIRGELHLVDDLGFDSVELLVAFVIVGELGVDIPETAAVRIHTLGDLHQAYVDGLGGR